MLKNIFGPPSVDYQFWLPKYSPIFMVFILPDIGPFCLFWAFQGSFWGCGQAQNLFTPYLCRPSTLVLEVQRFLLFQFGPIWGSFFFTFFGPFRAIFLVFRVIFRVGSGLTIILRPTNVDYQFLFLKYSPIFLFLIWPNFGPFALFGPFGVIFFLARWGFFWGSGQAQKHFQNLQMQTINFCFGSRALSFCF